MAASNSVVPHPRLLPHWLRAALVRLRAALIWLLRSALIRLRSALSDSSYERYFASELRFRIAFLRNELNVAHPTAKTTGQPVYNIIDECLTEAKAGLGEPGSGATRIDRFELRRISHMLDQAERDMVYLDDSSARRAKATHYLYYLTAPGMEEWRIPRVESALREMVHKTNPAADSGNEYRDMLVEAIVILGKKRFYDHLENELQIERLKSFRVGMFLAVPVLVLVAPLLANPQTVPLPALPVSKIAALLPFLAGIADWLPFLGLTAIGAVGGLFSGLLEARDTRARYKGYEESIYKLGLRPLVGAFLALMLSILLSWEILGVETLNLGTYVLLAFLSGFSERYFLRLLPLETVDTRRYLPDYPLENR